MAEALIRILHLTGAAGIAAGIVIAILAAGSINAAETNESGSAPGDTDQDQQHAALAKIYVFIGLSVLVTLLGGLILWFVVGKPAAFFSSNPVFHAKMALFAVLLGLLSWPAWYIFTRDQGNGQIPSPLVRLQKAALPVLLIMPVLAYLMARGIGY